MTYKIKVGLDPELMVTYGPKDAKQLLSVGRAHRCAGLGMGTRRVRTK